MDLIRQVHAAPVDLGSQYGFGQLNSLGEGFGYLVRPGFTVAFLALLFFTLYAAVKWISSGGDKDNIAAARKMITHSIIGFILLVLMFTILQFIPERLGLQNLKIIKP